VDFPPFPVRVDSVDAASGGLVFLAALFVAGFFWQASSGAAGSEEALFEELRAAARERILGEREAIRDLLALEGEGGGGEVLERAVERSRHLGGNSQLHLLIARRYGEEGNLPLTLREYRRALEANRDYSDRRSEFYLGGTLRPLLAQAKTALLARGLPGKAGEGAEGAVRDLFYIERSLAGGCH